MIYFPRIFFNELCSVHAKRSGVQQRPRTTGLVPEPCLDATEHLDLALDFRYWLAYTVHKGARRYYIDVLYLLRKESSLESILPKSHLLRCSPVPVR